MAPKPLSGIADVAAVAVGEQTRPARDRLRVHERWHDAVGRRDELSRRRAGPARRLRQRRPGRQLVAGRARRGRLATKRMLLGLFGQGFVVIHRCATTKADAGRGEHHEQVAGCGSHGFDCSPQLVDGSATRPQHPGKAFSRPGQSGAHVRRVSSIQARAVAKTRMDAHARNEIDAEYWAIFYPPVRSGSALVGCLAWTTPCCEIT